MSGITLRDYESEIEQLIDDAHYIEAFAHLQHILDLYPRYVGAYTLLGKMMLVTDQPDLAADLFRRVLNADPENFIARLGLARAHQQLGHVDAANWNLERAVELSPGDTDLSEELAASRPHIATTPESEIASDGASQAATFDRSGLARLYIRAGRYQEAIAELEALLEDEPKRPDLLTPLAEAYWRNEQPRKVVTVCRRILDDLPYHLRANVLMGAIFGGNWQQEGRFYLRRASDVDPEHIIAIELMGPDSPLPYREVTIEKLEQTTAAHGAVQSAEWFRRLAERTAQAERAEAVADRVAPAVSTPEEYHVPQADLIQKAVPDTTPETTAETIPETSPLPEMVEAAPVEPALPEAELAEMEAGPVIKDESLETEIPKPALAPAAVEPMPVAYREDLRTQDEIDHAAHLAHLLGLSAPSAALEHPAAPEASLAVPMRVVQEESSPLAEEPAEPTWVDVFETEPEPAVEPAVEPVVEPATLSPEAEQDLRVAMLLGHVEMDYAGGDAAGQKMSGRVGTSSEDDALDWLEGQANSAALMNPETADAPREETLPVVDQAGAEVVPQMIDQSVDSLSTNELAEDVVIAEVLGDELETPLVEEEAHAWLDGLTPEKEAEFESMIHGVEDKEPAGQVFESEPPSEPSTPIHVLEPAAAPSEPVGEGQAAPAERTEPAEQRDQTEPSEPTAAVAPTDDQTVPATDAEPEAPARTRAAAEISVPDADDLDGMRAYLKRKRSDHRARLVFCRALWEAGEYEESLQHYGRLIKSGARLQEVQDDLERYIEAQPEHLGVLQALGDLYAKRGDLDQALVYYNRAMKNT